MLYCAHADDKSTGEPSRYIHQIDYESGLPVARVEVGVDVNLAETAPIEVAKDAAVMASLERFVSPESEAALSPTAFSATWPARCASTSTPWRGCASTTR